MYGSLILLLFSPAQKTVFAHSNKIKELRAEIQNEKMRHQSVDNTLQGKITLLVTCLLRTADIGIIIFYPLSQNNDLVIARTKISGLEEELKQTKAQSSAETIEKLQEQNAMLKKSLDST